MFSLERHSRLFTPLVKTEARRLAAGSPTWGGRISTRTGHTGNAKQEKRGARMLDGGAFCAFMCVKEGACTMYQTCHAKL
jgi:hypothetical protein